MVQERMCHLSRLLRDYYSLLHAMEMRCLPGPIRDWKGGNQGGGSGLEEAADSLLPWEVRQEVCAK